jgi:hypothetical protein
MTYRTNASVTRATNEASPKGTNASGSTTPRDSGKRKSVAGEEYSRDKDKGKENGAIDVIQTQTGYAFIFFVFFLSSHVRNYGTSFF